VILIVSFPDNEHVEEVRRHLTAPHVILPLATKVTVGARPTCTTRRLADSREGPGLGMSAR
jgi:hypothetical protein